MEVYDTDGAASTASAYAERGWAVFPCDPGSKRPLVASGFYAATTDRGLIEKWWSKWPRAAIGLRTGAASGVDVLDLDIKNGVDGFATLSATIDVSAQADTLKAATPGGGEHWFYRHSAGSRCCKPGPGLDFKAEGGYVLLPDGGARRWLNDQPIASAPDWLGRLLSTRGPPSSYDQRGGGPLMAHTALELPKPIYFRVCNLVADRHDRRRVAGILKIALARTKDRNDGLNIAAYVMGREMVPEVISYQEAEELLFAVAVHIRYVATDTAAAALATIESGLRSGMNCNAQYKPQDERGIAPVKA